MVVECPICGARETRSFGQRSGFLLGQCGSCRHSFVRNLPSAAELVAVYERYSYESLPLEALPRFLQRVVQENVTSFAPHRRTGRLLDVGFGAGGLLLAARHEGWRPYGVETSELAVAQAKANGLGDVVLGEFLEVPFDPGFFDVIVMSELVEHLPEPMPYLRRARTLLAPGGLLYLTTPHGRGISGRVLRSEWSVCSPPEHLHLFSRSSMRSSLARAGFGTTRVEVRNVHPHELVRWAFRRFAPPRATRDDAPTPEAFSADERNAGSYRLNAALLGSAWGRAAKRAVNRVLDLTSLGDGLVVRAVVPASPASPDASPALA